MQSQVKRRIAFGITTGGLLAGGGLGFAHADTAGTGSGATGTAAGSPGILSGNNIQIPVDIPINVCGVTASVVGVLNTAAHNECSNSGGASAGGAPASGSSASGSSTASGGAQDSPGILSGNNVQVPVNAPVNVCGDTVSVVGVGDTAKHNGCANHGGAAAGGGPGGGAVARGGTSGSPGILSGNNIQIPVNVPVNVCGDSVSVIGVGDTAKHNDCANHGAPVVTPPPTTTTTPPPVVTPPPTTTTPPPGRTKPHTTGETVGEAAPPAPGSLAHTGAEGLLLAPVGAALIGGGAFLVRKYKPKGSH